MDWLAVVAIDFGTTYSGYAFSYKSEYEINPLKISGMRLNGGSTSLKDTTCILINSDLKTDSFGYEAEKKYAEICGENKQDQWFFFKLFKMILFNNKGITRHHPLKDASGKKLPAMKVFSLAIEYLKKHVLNKLSNQIDGEMVVNDVRWVLTVPAIWNDAAKQFMREAAQKAGIPKKNLLLCLEPEAASICCRHLQVSKEATSISQFSSGTKYLVLDAGGGTVDITVHEVSDSGKLRELHKASGGAWGGTQVDKAYEEGLLGSIVGREVFSKFKRQHMEDYIDFCHSFDCDKRYISPTKRDGKVTIRMIPSLSELCEEMKGKCLKDLFLQSKFNSKGTVTGDKIRISTEVYFDFFKPTVHNIISHVKDLLSKPAVQGCAAILMVGGFSESPMLQENVRSTFQDLKVVIPDEAGLAVLKGAVIYGHQPTTITERICKFTYGTNVSHIYRETCKHRKGRVETDDNGDLRCYDLFDIHVKAGQSVKLNEEQPERIGAPITDDQTNIAVDLYSSSSTDPHLTTEDGCNLIGKLIIPISDTSSGRKHEFGKIFIFGGTEIVVKVVDKESGEEIFKSVDFLG